jgi:type III pantothenate kinase
VSRFLADLGNSRLKWGRLDAEGRLCESLALPLDRIDAWESVWRNWNPRNERSTWAVSSVNPPVAARLAAFLAEQGVSDTRWYRSVADVPVPHVLENPESGGADRGLAVLAASELSPPGRPGRLVSCGTAITVERIDEQKVWQGGAIAPGLGLSARALHALTAQLPLIEVRPNPLPWGRAAEQAMEAGVFWGTVGAIRELLARQSDGSNSVPWLIWTGGDAHVLAPAVVGDGAHVVPNLVLEGLRRVAFERPAH